jgi:pyruvate ferredoxin oxidoreductase gamma subunit
MRRKFLPARDLRHYARPRPEHTLQLMFEVRLHGRGGQGAVTAADLLALAAFEEGRYAQSFPSFGSERTGAPVVSYCRLGDREIRTREPVVSPHCLIVIDPTLLHQVDLFSGLRAGGYVVVNSTKSLRALGLREPPTFCDPDHALAVPATEVARRQIGRPLPNAGLLGAFAALTGEIALDSLSAAIRERFGREPAVAERNVAAAAEIYQLARRSMSASESGRAVLGAAAD